MSALAKRPFNVSSIQCLIRKPTRLAYAICCIYYVNMTLITI